MKPQFSPEEPAQTRTESGVVEPHWAELSALVSRAQANRAAMSRLHAERAELCAEAIALVADRVAQRAAARRTVRRTDLGDDIPLREVIAELGAALRISDQTLRSWLGDGDALVHRFPATLDALRTGRIDERHASAIVDGGEGLSEGVRDEYERRVLSAAQELTGPALRETARVIAGRLQPALIESRCTSAYERRRIRSYSIEDGLVRLVADGPAALVLAMFDRLTEMAQTLDGAAAAADAADAAYATDGDDRRADDRCLDERRFDILADMVLTGAPAAHGDGDALAAIRGSVHVTIPVLTLAGLDDEPAVLAGHGPIDPDTARCIAANAPGWDRILTHPHTGAVLAVDRYTPSADLRRYLTARDRHCRWPGCRRPARQCDADHTIAHAEGGATRAENLAMLCRRHHVLKHASLWHMRQLGGGALEFTSPTGRRYPNNAPPIVEFIPPRWQTPYDPRDRAPF